MREQALGALRFGEGNHVAYGFGAGHQGNQPVQPERQPAVRGRAVLQGVEQEAEFLPLLVRADVERGEDFGLHVGAVDADGAAAQFPAVEHHVVGARLALFGVLRHQVFVPRFGAGEGVVHGVPAALGFVPLEHGEVHDPERRPAVFKQAVCAPEFAQTDFQAQRADGVADDARGVGAEKEDVAVLRAAALQNGADSGVVQVFDDGRLQPVAPGGHVVDFYPRQPARAVNLDEFGVAVNFAAADGRAARHAQRHDAPAGGVGGAAEDFEVHVAHGVGEFGEFHLHAQVGLVGAEAVHRLGVGHDGEVAQLHAERLAEDEAHHLLRHGADVFLLKEGGFNINLREFGLAVGAQVLVAEALGDLVVAVKARDHEHLLEKLRRLRQGVKVPVVHAAGHEVVARAFGRAAREHGGFDVHKAVLVQKTPHHARDLVAQQQVALHHGAAQVNDAVRQARGFADALVIKLEGRRGGRIEHRQLVAEHFYLPAFQLWICRAFGTRAHAPRNLDAELVAQALGGAEHVGAVGVADHLHAALAVAQVNEDDAAVVAAAVDPAAQGDSLTIKRLGDEAAVVGSHWHGVVVGRLVLCVFRRAAVRAALRQARRFHAEQQRPWK